MNASGNSQKINDISILFGGEAGYGIMSLGVMMAYAASRGGLNVFANNEVPSLIRGGHNTYQVRIKDTPVTVHTDDIQLLVALHAEAVTEHLTNLAQDGLILYDEQEMETVPSGDKRFIMVPFKRLAIEAGKNLLMRNTISLGAVFACIDYDVDILHSVITDTFKRKGDEVVDMNIKAAMSGYDYIKEQYKLEFPYKVTKIEHAPRFMVDANEATALGAIRAGCNFIAAYPMTPGSSIWLNIAKQAEKYNIVVKQTEDEIAAMNMIIGAGHMGARSMTATSGGGFSLMVEALGMAGMTETPCVVINSQRPGPSTGLPTRSEQGDLRFMMHASQGEFPRVVMAPGSPTQAFEMIGEAFNLAERYQLPVLFLLDKYISSSKMTVDEFDQEEITIDRGKLIPKNKLVKDYKRFEITEDGVSPRALPGSPNVFWTSTDEHIEVGHLREDEATRIAMVDKRARKLTTLRKELQGYVIHGNKDAKTVFVVWGSTLGAALEAQEALAETGVDVCVLQITHFIPFNAEDIQKLLTEKDVYVIEGNSEGQLAGIIQEQTLLPMKKRILRYDGRAFTSDYIINHYHELKG
jgi:2-oxoglutarate ferredoxin oxidoreductase subunit alpha